MMSAHNILVVVGLLAFASYVVYATDPTQLQDFCVGANDPNNACNTLSIYSIYMFSGGIIVVHKAFLR